MSESRSRDREMQLIADEHLQMVLEFMQSNIPMYKLVGVAEHLPEMARLLWRHVPQEPLTLLALRPIAVSMPCEIQPVATESDPDQACAGDDSVAAICAPAR
jgi:hypothetical protein